jgi:hypothetical protein
MEADRLRPRRLPEDVVLENADASVAGELRGESGSSLRQNLCGDDGVGLPGVAELARSVLGIAAGDPVHLVGPDPGLVLALEESQVALAQAFEGILRDEALFDDEKAVAAECFDPLFGERVDQDRGRVLSGS